MSRFELEPTITPTCPFGHGISNDINISSIQKSFAERGSPSLARARGNLVGRGIANPQELLLAGNGYFESYLKVQKKRNIKQIICYAKRYHSVLETGNASMLVSLSSSGAVRRHAMEALAAYAKYQGCYDTWQQIRNRYSLHWTNGDESLRSLQRFLTVNFPSIR